MCGTSGPQSTDSCDHCSYFKPVKQGTGPNEVSQNQVRLVSMGAKRGAGYIRGGALYPESWTRFHQHFLNIVSYNIISYLPLCREITGELPRGRASHPHPRVLAQVPALPLSGAVHP